jgi:hypothetical protein
LITSFRRCLRNIYSSRNFLRYLRKKTLMANAFLWSYFNFLKLKIILISLKIYIYIYISVTINSALSRVKPTEALIDLGRVDLWEFCRKRQRFLYLWWQEYGSRVPVSFLSKISGCWCGLCVATCKEVRD